MLRSESEGSTNEFLKTENKAKLWSLLQNNGAFNGISNSFFATVRKDFESMVTRIDREHSEKEKMAKNKIFLDTMIQKMMEYRKQSYTQPYTADEIRQTKVHAFDNELAKKQDDFNHYNSKPTPNSIDFKDKEDGANGSVNDLLERAIRDRENLVMPPAPIAKDTTNIEPTQTMSAAAATDQASLSTSVVPPSVVSGGLATQVDNNLTMEILVKIMQKLEEIEKMIANK
jgi:hypothetical protein